MASKKSPVTAGYSGTPLAKKLGIVEGSHVHLIQAPKALHDWLAPIPAGVVFDRGLSDKTDVIHVFATERAELAKHLKALRSRMRADATIWVSWPKKAAKVETDITEDVIRDVSLPIGLVDVKVCAVSDVWSGLKLVIRKTLRD